VLRSGRFAAKTLSRDLGLRRRTVVRMPTATSPSGEPATQDKCAGRYPKTAAAGNRSGLWRRVTTVTSGLSSRDVGTQRGGERSGRGRRDDALGSVNHLSRTNVWAVGAGEGLLIGLQHPAGQIKAGEQALGP
jgi:hypothetical protein